LSTEPVTAREAAWRFVKREWDTMDRMYPKHALRRMAEGVTGPVAKDRKTLSIRGDLLVRCADAARVYAFPTARDVSLRLTALASRPHRMYQAFGRLAPGATGDPRSRPTSSSVSASINVSCPPRFHRERQSPSSP